MPQRTCSIESCPGKVHCRGWCKAHYTRWRRHGDPEGGQHDYRLDHAYFDSPDTEAKAYWLGFITADGCVSSGPAGANGWMRNLLAVKLKASDIGHLEKLKADLAAENPVRFVPQAGKGHPAVEIAFTSAHLVESLIRLGVTPRKSLTAEPWDGPADLMRHYWRGLFDGDGSIIRSPGLRDKWQMKIIGTEAVVKAFRKWAVPISGSAATLRPKDNIWTWTAGGLASPQAVAREMYGGATVFLDRKHERAQQLMALPILHRSWLRPEVSPALF